MPCRKIASELQILRCSAKNIVSPIVGSLIRSYSSRKDLEKPTHTGQALAVRFTNAKRYINKNWGIKLIDEIPPKEHTERVVYCDGGDGPLGQVNIFMAIAVLDS